MQNVVTFTAIDAFAAAGEDEETITVADCIQTRVYPSLAAAAQYEGESDASYVAFSPEAVQSGAKRLYVPSLDMPDPALDTLIEYTLENEIMLKVACGRTLEETGRIDTRFGKSPVMLLHAFGLLPYSEVVSGVYLDKDDLSLMAQECVPLIALPTTDAGRGNGVAPVSAALARGVRVRLGTGDGMFNRKRSVLCEAAALRILAAVQLNRQNAVSARELAKMCLEDGATDAQIAAAINALEMY